MLESLGFFLKGSWVHRLRIEIEGEHLEVHMGVSKNSGCPKMDGL